MEWDARSAAFAFAGLGLLSAIVQGGLIRRLVPGFGEPRLIVAGALTVALGFAAMALVSNVPGAGRGDHPGGGRPGPGRPFAQRLALADHADERAGGRLRDALLGARPWRRMISYSVANVLLGRVAISAPYWFGFAVYLVSSWPAVRFLARLNVDANGGKPAEAGAITPFPLMGQWIERDGS